MAEQTKISWADATWNPWMGCKKVSPGCAKCYMFRDMTFYGKDPSIVARSKTAFDAPIKWAARWAKGIHDEKSVAPGSRIFTCSWSDWFIDKADPWRKAAWDIIWATPDYIYMILTKRPERILDHLPADWGEGYPNVWIGVSAENQKMADKRIPQLLEVPAKVHFVSAEPLLGPIDFTRLKYTPAGDVLLSTLPEGATPVINSLRGFIDNGSLRKLDWIITGGESDKTDPRLMNMDDARSIRNQCVSANVAYWHKQNGGKTKIGGEWGGNEIDGQVWHQLPQSDIEKRVDRIEL